MIDKRLLREARRVRFYLALTVGLGTATGTVVVMQASYLARIINGVFLAGQNLRQVFPWLLILLGIILVRAALTWLNEISAHRAAAQIKGALREQLLARLLALGPLQVRGERTGELVNLLVEGVEALEDYFSRYLPQLALAAMVPLLILGFVFPLDLTSGFILLITAPLIPFFMILIGKWADHLTRQQWDRLSRMSAHFLDILQGLTTLKVFGRSKDQIQVIARVSNQFRETTLGVLRVAFLSALVLELLSTISTALVAVALGLRLVYGRIPFEQAFFLLLLAPEFYLPLRLLGSSFHAGMSGTTAANRIFEVLEMPVPVAAYPAAGQRVEAPLHISLRDVHYAYEAGTRAALRGVSFDLHPGERVALVGPSGAGKSTVAHLLLRFMEPDQGTISVNDIPLQKIPPDDWCQQVALVPQNPYLFYGTVADNILWGRPGATREEVIKAAQQAGAHRFISQLPQGYDTLVGEQGLRLSGGQAQRIAIARAFLKDAPLLILDEATAGLDPASEQVVHEALDRLMQGRTVLMITHSLATVERADRILVLAAGRVA
ncbi:thiol reductant ABC exporter subunit CydD [Desulfotomaculum nigrificans]|uniref:thiol reductant ABC exporter subunit CydD n=1 Tax=Desulfotomaculum nigrificans TaxID=1565 RepID=UPI0001FAE63B|nr:thiol reductant ABC exporter subunit CydD [Desulfotomaculum nigrificans]